MKPSLFAAVMAAMLLLSGHTAQAMSEYLDYDLKNRIDVSGGSAYGVLVDFTFNMPFGWTKYVLASQTVSSGDSKLIERMSFYCTSVTKRYKPALLLTVSVYYRNTWDSDFAYDIILKTPKYVFGIERGIERPFEYIKDLATFNDCYSKINTVEKIKACFAFPEGEGEITKHNVVVADKVLKNTVVVEDKTYYVPVREISETLGYTVFWNEREMSFTIKKGSFSDKQILSGAYTNRGYPYILRNGTTYISTSYIYRVLGMSVEIDAQGNAFIT